MILLFSQVFAQDLTETFEKLYKDFKTYFVDGKYSDSLDILEELKVLIENGKEIKQESLLKSKTNDSDFDALFEKVKSPVEFYVGNEGIKVHYGANIIYVIKNDPNSYIKYSYLFSNQLPIEFSGKLAIQNKYCKIDGQTKIVKFKSNNEDILTIDIDGKFEVKKSGNAIITISVDDKFTQIPLKIIEIPVSKNMSREKIIEILGLPDKENKKYISWVESAYVDGIFYYANTSNGSGISVEHWIYNKYPKAILRFNYSGLSSCVMANWEKLSTIKYSLEHK